MAIYTRVEFAAECGVKPAYITQYIKRKKVVLNDDGKINTDNPFNAEFLSKRKEKKNRPVSQSTAPTEIKAPTQLTALPKNIPAPEGKSADEVQRYNMERKSKELEIEIKEQKVEENKIKIAKLKGDVIPTDLVNIVFAQHFRTVTTSFHNAADNYISVIIARLGGKKEDIAFIRGELIEVVNQAVKDSIAESKASVKSIANEYSQKRGKGESK